MTTKKVYLVETNSSHRLLYAIMTDKNIDDPNVKGEIENIIHILPELKQSWAGEDIESISPAMTLEDFHDVFDVLVSADGASEEEKNMSITDVDKIIDNKDEMLNEAEDQIDGS
jgi:hypothetical protein